MKLIATIEGQPIYAMQDRSVVYNGCLRVDDDGSGQSHGDPCHQNQTSLLVDGKPLNADVDRYIVVPPQIIKGVPGIVLGCLAHLCYNGQIYDAVVGDVGPSDRLGEASIALIQEMGVDANPNTGGLNTPVVEYHLFPGVPALINGKLYNLQASQPA